MRDFHSQMFPESKNPAVLSRVFINQNINLGVPFGDPMTIKKYESSLHVIRTSLQRIWCKMEKKAFLDIAIKRIQSTKKHLSNLATVMTKYGKNTDFAFISFYLYQFFVIFSAIFKLQMSQN